jgi:hypothetical protein
MAVFFCEQSLKRGWFYETDHVNNSSGGDEAILSNDFVLMKNIFKEGIF